MAKLTIESKLGSRAGTSSDIGEQSMLAHRLLRTIVDVVHEDGRVKSKDSRGKYYAYHAQDKDPLLDINVTDGVNSIMEIEQKTTTNGVHDTTPSNREGKDGSPSRTAAHVNMDESSTAVKKTNTKPKDFRRTQLNDAMDRAKNNKTLGAFGFLQLGSSELLGLDELREVEGRRKFQENAQKIHPDIRHGVFGVEFLTAHDLKYRAGTKGKKAGKTAVVSRRTNAGFTALDELMGAPAFVRRNVVDPGGTVVKEKDEHGNEWTVDRARKDLYYRGYDKMMKEENLFQVTVGKSLFLIGGRDERSRNISIKDAMAELKKTQVFREATLGIIDRESQRIKRGGRTPVIDSNRAKKGKDGKSLKEDVTLHAFVGGATAHKLRSNYDGPIRSGSAAAGYIDISLEVSNVSFQRNTSADEEDSTKHITSHKPNTDRPPKKKTTKKKVAKKAPAKKKVAKKKVAKKKTPTAAVARGVAKKASATRKKKAKSGGYTRTKHGTGKTEFKKVNGKRISRKVA